jgi:hypothetical protein
VVFDEFGDFVRTDAIKKQGGDKLLGLLVGCCWSWSQGEPPKKAHTFLATSMGVIEFDLHGALICRFLLMIRRVCVASPSPPPHPSNAGTVLTSQRRRDVGLSYLDREQNDFLLDARLQQEDGTPLLNEEQKAAIFESLGGHLRPLCNHLIPDLQTPGADLNSESCLYFLFLQVLF